MRFYFAFYFILFFLCFVNNKFKDSDKNTPKITSFSFYIAAQQQAIFKKRRGESYLNIRFFFIENKKGTIIIKKKQKTKIGINNTRKKINK